MHLMMMGLHPGYVDAFSGVDDLEVTVVEEPDLFDEKSGLYDHPRIKDVVSLAHQAAPLSGPDLGRLPRVDGVVAAYEYGVRAASQVQACQGLRSLGSQAVSGCTDKIRLRRLASESAVAQPRWRVVAGPDDVRAFAQDVGDTIVVKPSNRRASVGVVQVSPSDDVDERWQQCVRAAESRSTASDVRSAAYIAEEYMPGAHVSVETMYVDSREVFANVSRLVSAGGPYFPIMEVSVPADPPDSVALRGAVRALAGVLGAEHGVLHSEWIFHADRWHLVEVAGRVPGVFIPELWARTAEGWSMYELAIRVACGLPFPTTPRPTGVAGARWVDAALRQQITETSWAAAVARHRPFLSGLRAPSGTGPARNGWERSGYACTWAPDGEQLADRLDGFFSEARQGRRVAGVVR